MDLEQRFET